MDPACALTGQKPMFYQSVKHRISKFYVPFKKKRVRGLHQVSKSKKDCFRTFGNLMKPEARVLEITSATKKISLNYHLNKFSQFGYYILDVKCDSIT